MNIQNLPWFKFGHDAYLISEFKAQASAVAKAAYFDLLCYAMKQSPALSLPNCDNVLAGWASLTLDAWQQIKDLVLSQFSLNQDDNRYYSPMLVELYSSPSNSTELTPHNSGELHQIKKRSSSAERVARHRAKHKQSNADVTPPVTLDVTLSNANVTPSNVTLGGKGGDLDLRLENLEKEVVVNKDFVTKQSVTPCNAVTPKSVTQHTTTFCMHFDFKVEPSELEPFMAKLDVPMTKHTSTTLNHFVAYYLPKNFKNTRDEWVYQYAKWLKREKETPVDNLSPQPTKLAAAYIQPVKPLWETMAEQKAQRQAEATAKNPEQLAAADAAFAEMKKKLGLKAA
ncbi:MAG: DUF1376 domain-containing protein [Moraxellaceae bacterium]|nr:DUF1376 domain-containing protein [Moraxellaceae bacterium]